MFTVIPSESIAPIVKQQIHRGGIETSEEDEERRELYYKGLRDKITKLEADLEATKVELKEVKARCVLRELPSIEEEETAPVESAESSASSTEAEGSHTEQTES